MKGLFVVLRGRYRRRGGLWIDPRKESGAVDGRVSRALRDGAWRALGIWIQEKRLGAPSRMYLYLVGESYDGQHPSETT